MRRAALFVVAVLLASCGLLVASWLASTSFGPAQAADLAAAQSGGQKVAVFESVTVGPGDSWNNIVVVGGDLIVEGTVTNGVVVVGGDLTVRSGGSVGHSPNAHPDDAVIVCVFGKVTVDSGAVVSGRTIDVAGGASGALHNALVDPVVRPWTLGSAIEWILSTIFIVIVAVVATAIAPRQVAFVGGRAGRHPLSSLGWGILFLFIGVPLVTAVLFVTVIGIIVAVPWLFIGVPLILLFGYVSVGALIGRSLVGADNGHRGRVMLGAVIGVVILSVLRWIPFAGALVVFVALMMGFGALFTAVWEWRRRRRSVGPQPAGPPPVAGPPYGSTGDAGPGFDARPGDPPGASAAHS